MRTMSTMNNGQLHHHSSPRDAGRHGSQTTVPADTRPLAPSLSGSSGRSRWPLYIIGLLATQAAGVGVMIAIATSDPSVAVEPEYYEKALAWDDAAASEAATKTLGWSALVTAGPLSSTDRELSIALKDKAGRGIAEARVHVEMFHQARSGQRLTAELTGMGAGVYVARLPIQRPGLWEIRITAQHGRDKAAMIQSIEVQ
jgi:nitrogen fixation protein FixH